MNERNRPWILGFSASHNGSACLIHGDELVICVQEERLSRNKRQRVFGPYSRAAEYCLQYANLKFENLDLVVGSSFILDPIPSDPIHALPCDFRLISHHLGHAWAVFVTSGFADATVMIIDGQGTREHRLESTERKGILRCAGPGIKAYSETISVYDADDQAIQLREKHVGDWIPEKPKGGAMPQFGSLGGMFAAAAYYSFGDLMESGKVMGLAPYGKPEISTDHFFSVNSDGSFIFRDDVVAEHSESNKWPGDLHKHQRLAASVQRALEDGLRSVATRAETSARSTRLCYAGGVALNSVANERVLFHSDFEDIYIMPAADDSGPSIGAAYFGLHALTGKIPRRRLARDSVGRSYSTADAIESSKKLPIESFIPSRPVSEVTAELLASGKIVGWFQGGSELGPRALGHRSILCDPRRQDGKDVLNSRVKHREAFRPFAPVIPLENVEDWFDVDARFVESPFMLRVCDFREERRHLVPAVVHIDGTGRVQTITKAENGRFYDTVKAFNAKTSVPLILNTSFNIAGEPIVETPQDAIWCFLSTGIDALVIEDAVFLKSAEYRNVLQLRFKLSIKEVQIKRKSVERPLSGELDDATFDLLGARKWAASYLCEFPEVAILREFQDGAIAEEVFKKITTEHESDLTPTAFIELMGRWMRAGILDIFL